MQLQQLDPIFNMGVDVMRPAVNLDSKYMVTMLTREEWTRRPGTPPVVKGLGQRQRRGLGLESRAICGKKAQYFSRKLCYSFSG
jgi:hypothetical protein